MQRKSLGRRPRRAGGRTCLAKLLDAIARWSVRRSKSEQQPAGRGADQQQCRKTRTPCTIAGSSRTCAGWFRSNSLRLSYAPACRLPMLDAVRLPETDAMAMLLASVDRTARRAGPRCATSVSRIGCPTTGLRRASRRRQALATGTDRPRGIVRPGPPRAVAATRRLAAEGGRRRGRQVQRVEARLGLGLPSAVSGAPDLGVARDEGAPLRRQSREMAGPVKRRSDVAVACAGPLTAAARCRTWTF